MSWTARVPVMPPRAIVATIIAFWLAANGWLFYREAWPYLRAGEPPPYSIDLTEELGSANVHWEILKKDKVIGHAVSRVERQRDQTFKLHMTYRFEKLRVVILDIRKLDGVYHVTEDGDLLGVSASAAVTMKDKRGSLDLDLEMKGRVEDGLLVPEVFFNNEKLALGDLKVKVAGQGGAINPLHPLNRLKGLHVGRRWRITLFDPLSALTQALGPQFQELAQSLEGISVRELHAVVKADTLFWDNADVECFKIEYRVPGEAEPVASTWVRQRDGLVLQQHSSHGLSELTLRRSPTR